MAKNIYKKYRAAVKFEYRLIERDRNYDFSSDTTYTPEQRKKLSGISDVSISYYLRAKHGSSDKDAIVSIDYSADEYSKKIKSSREKEIYDYETYDLNAYFNLDSFKLGYSSLKIIDGLTGYEDGNIFLKYRIGYTDSDASLFYNNHFLGTVEYRKVSTGFQKGEYLGEVEAEAGTYPLEQNYNGYWYEYDRPANYPPQISGSDYDMGSKTENFDIEYYVSDQNDVAINVKILLDDIQKETKKVFNNQKNIYTVNLQDLNLGSHTVKIIATDSFGASDTRTYTFYKSNAAPKISGQDKDLGGKSLGFTITYDVTDSDGDEVDVTISLNNEELSNITTNSKNGLTFTLDDERVKKLTIGDIYTITIKADDRKGGVAYRRYTFTKTNSVPVISGNDKDLGNKSEAFSYTFSVTDYEKNPISFRVKLDDKVIKEVDKGDTGVGIAGTPGKDGRTPYVHTAWSRSSDGINGFSNSYPGENLIVRTGELANTIVGNDGSISKFYGNALMANKITVTPGEALTFSRWGDNTSGQDAYFRYGFYTDTDVLVMRESSPSKHFTITVPANATKLKVSYPSGPQVKLEKGSIATPWYPSPTDDPINAYPSYRGEYTDYTEADSDDPTKYEWALIKDPKGDGEEYTAEISYDDFIRLSYGEHKITIEAWDSINQDKVQVRELTFTRVSNGLDVEIELATSKVQPKKIIAVPHGIFAPDATLQVLVCNNYLDSDPVWEDATEMSNIARAYAFENTVKEGDEWAIGIKVIIENGESGVSSILRGMKGGFE